MNHMVRAKRKREPSRTIVTIILFLFFGGNWIASIPVSTAFFEEVSARSIAWKGRRRSPSLPFSIYSVCPLVFPSLFFLHAPMDAHPMGFIHHAHWAHCAVCFDVILTRCVRVISYGEMYSAVYMVKYTLCLSRSRESR